MLVLFTVLFRNQVRDFDPDVRMRYSLFCCFLLVVVFSENLYTCEFFGLQNVELNFHLLFFYVYIVHCLKVLFWHRLTRMVTEKGP